MCFMHILCVEHMFNQMGEAGTEKLFKSSNSCIFYLNNVFFES